jgi:hypothetical protein
MYYVNHSIKLIARVQIYLQLIQEANNRHERKRSKLAMYDSIVNDFSKNRIMEGRSKMIIYMYRMQNLSEWLVIRMQSVLMELNQENDMQLKKILFTQNEAI